MTYIHSFKFFSIHGLTQITCSFSLFSAAQASSLPNTSIGVSNHKPAKDFFLPNDDENVDDDPEYLQALHLLLPN
jgi:hypothetical protein